MSVNEILDKMVHDPELDDTEYEAHFDRIVAMGKSALRPLLSAIGSMDADTRYVATEAFSRVFGALSNADVLDYLIAGDDERLRGEAAYVLGLRGDNEHVNALTMALRDRSPRVRKSAAQALGMIGDASAADALAITQEDLNTVVRQQATIALANIGDWRAGLAFARLVADTDHVSASVREGAVEALGSLEDERVMMPILRALNDSAPEVRAQAARSLIRHPDRRAIAYLNEALSDEDIWVRYYASQALYWIEDADISDTDAEYSLPDIASLESELLDEGGPVDVEVLQRHLKNPDTLIVLRAIQMLGESQVRAAVGVVSECLYHEDNRVKKAAAVALGIIGDKRAADPLLVAASSQDAELRNLAARALHQLEDNRVDSIQMLIEQDLLSHDPQVRELAATTLGMFGDAYAVDQLVHLLSDRVTRVRVAAIVALGEIADDMAVEPLIMASLDELAVVRVAVAEVLGAIGSAESFETLMRLMRDDHARVRVATAEALRQLGDRRAIQHLVPFLNDKDADVCTAVAAALQELLEKSESRFIDI